MLVSDINVLTALRVTGERAYVLEQIRPSPHFNSSDINGKPRTTLVSECSASANISTLLRLPLTNVATMHHGQIALVGKLRRLDRRR